MYRDVFLNEARTLHVEIHGAIQVDQNASFFLETLEPAADTVISTRFATAGDLHMPLPQRYDGCCHEKVNSSSGLQCRGGGNPTLALDKDIYGPCFPVTSHLTRAPPLHACSATCSNDRCARTPANYNIFSKSPLVRSNTVSFSRRSDGGGYARLFFLFEPSTGEDKRVYHCCLFCPTGKPAQVRSAVQRAGRRPLSRNRVGTSAREQHRFTGGAHLPGDEIKACCGGNLPR